jgi:hypothetical protein
MKTSQLDIGFGHDRTTMKQDWLTPPEIIKALGEFDLDPCSPVDRPWDTAKKHYTILDNGLRQEWGGQRECFLTLHMEMKQHCGCRNLPNTIME